MREFQTSLRIDHEHIDQYGHVNYIALPKLYEIAQDKALEACGLSFQGLEADYGIRSFVKRMELDYFDQLFEGDEVNVITGVGIGNTSMIFDQHMKKAGAITSQYKMVVVAVDSEGKKASIPEAVREAFKG